MRSGENPKKQAENAKNRLKIVSKPLKIARKRHLLPKHGIFELKNMRWPQAGREILARHVNILPTFRRKYPKLELPTSTLRESGFNKMGHP